jgi:hypothetical protein
LENDEIIFQYYVPILILNDVMWILFKKSLISILILVVAVSGLYAQQPYYYGYAVFNNGDTIKGQIREQPIRKRYEACLLREGNAGPFQSYSPSELQAYGVKGRYLFRSIEDSLQGKKVFMRCLIDGLQELYEERNQLILKKSDGDFVKLPTKETLVGKNNKKYNREHYREYYRVTDELISIMAQEVVSCPELFQDSLQKKYPLKATAKSILDLLIASHECQNHPYRVYKKPVTLEEIQPSFIVGVASMNVGYNVDRPLYYSDADFSRFLFPYIGIKGQWKSRHSVSFTHFQFGLYYKQWSHQGYYSS